MPDASPLLEARGLTKRFPGVNALDSVDLALRPSEILAVIGENGAGKSTLMKILAGILQPDSGTVLLDGTPVSLGSVRRATELGIALIHQELNLADNLSIGANVFLGREPRRFGLVDQPKIERDTERLLSRLGLPCSPKTLVSTLSIGQQQMVEIAKALSIEARILIMDEPTSSLSKRETAQLFDVIRDLQAHGVTVLYISHRLGEVREVADRVVVLRDGKNAGELAREAIAHDTMVRLMVGRDVARARQRTPAKPGPERLVSRDFTTPAHPHRGLSFSLRAGEIVGLAGLVGAGRSELLTTLFGITPARGGTVEIHGRPVRIRTPNEAIRHGLAFVPEDRKDQGLFLEMAVRQNLTLADLKARGKVLLNRKRERRTSEEMFRRLSIGARNDLQTVDSLSGGNQQKVVLGKWLAIQPAILLLDEPTRGIDVGAKSEIYKLIEELAEQGVAILLVSSELEEILTLSDRALVMYDGAITGELSREELSEEAVMKLATASVEPESAVTPA